ncbi:arylsulfatase [Seonamhaeicola maritimus]|uniref:Arylsulfatase n=1 Tax=Seonamhaeicola maritimus TaxID=2591822 RepID=A0A5C7GLB5_9FLAO|nr:arylsulfatase [Seonamhaeicola maritimus]TXG39054.1 arylsulfatase [Seonamhaeicola maritimus]
MKQLPFYLTIALGLILFSCKKEEKTIKQQPNVILILIDDQGYGDISALGNTFINTPNIDALHGVSARFTDYHVSPTCAPTRAALLTGRHNNRTGVWHTVNGRSLILEREITMAQIFKENGYATSMFGKWHLGDNYPFRPEDKGFEEVLTHGGGGMGQTMDYWDNDYFDDMYLHNGQLKRYEGYSADVWFDEAIKWIGSKEDKPFFCYIPSNTAHSNYNVEDNYYKDLEGNEDIPHAPFLGMIRNIDENLGKLVNYLKESNKLDNTILLFTTDNGTAQGAKTEGHRLDGFIKKGYNAGMRGVKASKYEGGHRVPLFIHWKDGNIAMGKDINELTAHYDILPTLVDLCDLNVDSKIKFDGESMVPLINGDNTAFKDRIVITNSQRVENPEPWRRTSLMQGSWRLVDSTELYNLKTDPEQRHNIADQHPEKVEAYRAAYKKWWKDISPSYKDQPYIIIGHEKENPSTLYGHDWHTDREASPWHQRHIRTGYIDNGHWLVRVSEAGKYTLKLRRWPKETGLALNAKAHIRPALPGTSVSKSKASKALNIQEAKISIQDIELTQTVNPNEGFVEFNIELNKGETQLQTWFTLDTKEVLGAYYVTVEKQ